MKKKNVEDLIPDAIDVIEEEFKGKKIPKEFNGYISSFGASIIQSGLKATVANYENRNSNSNQDKTKLTKMILKLLGGDGDLLLRYIINSDENEIILKEKIKTSAVAIKLAIRTFEFEKKDK